MRYENSGKERQRLPRKLTIALIGALVLAGAGLAGSFWPHAHTTERAPAPSNTIARQEIAPNHRNIDTTVFWVGEPPDADNQGITNISSAWVDNWIKEFGGVDNPKSRCGYMPCDFTPNENPFYFALPFNDYGADGTLKPTSVLEQIPWYNGPPPEGQSLVKNHWIAIIYDGRTAYAQWEDAGPFGEDDSAYVFGNKPPEVNAGLDVSPAINDYLHLDGEAKTSWRFVDAADVPAGPWTQTITTTGLNY